MESQGEPQGRGSLLLGPQVAVRALLPRQGSHQPSSGWGCGTCGLSTGLPSSFVPCSIRAGEQEDAFYRVPQARAPRWGRPRLQPCWLILGPELLRHCFCGLSGSRNISRHVGLPNASSSRGAAAVLKPPSTTRGNLTTAPWKLPAKIY